MSELDTTVRRQRLDRLRAAVGEVVISSDDFLSTARPLATVACSRLGHDPHLHRGVCRFLTRSLLECRQRNATLLIADGSAIAPWADRGAELMNVPVVHLTVGPADRPGHAGNVTISADNGDTLSHDAVAIALADRVDGLYVRKGGIIDRCFHDRVTQLQDASTRVAVSMTKKCAAPNLIAAGAIGWYGTRGTDVACELGIADTCTRTDSSWVDDGWTETEGQWLIHCTRTCKGPWPGQTMRQYRDSILLGDQRATQRGPVDSLLRIIRGGRLVAAATASAKTQRVVCFSALPVRELLQARCFRPHLGRWDYEPYGIAIRKTAAERLGVRPVVYGTKQDRDRLPVEDRYRFHPAGTTYDWTTEREWRSRESIELSQIDTEDLRVFVPSVQAAQQIAASCKWPITVLIDEVGASPVV